MSANTVKYAPEFHTKPVRSAPEDAQIDYRSIELTDEDLITTQLLAMAVLPAGHRLVMCALESDDLDTDETPAITASLGILNSNYGAALNAAPALSSGKNILTDSTICQAGGRATPTLAFTEAIGVDYVNDRIIALQFTTAPDVAAAAGTVGVIVGTMPA
jgi:hypothetical protein